MKTAVEWLKEQYDSCPPYEPFLGESEWEKAKEMEKDEVHNAWNDGYDKGTRDRIEKISNPVGNAEQYYNETFKSE